MEIFNPCDKAITGKFKKQTQSPRGGYPPQGLSRRNPNAIPCSDCGSTERKVGADKAPGEASLLCECGKFLRWINKSELAKITGEQGGRS
jgi:hypothetical protein